MAGNPNWKKGGSSPNPRGRRKYKNSAQTIKGKLERFIKQNLTINELNRMYNDLNSKQQFTLLIELLPFVLPKQSSLTADLNFDRMSDTEIEDVYAKLFNQVNNKLYLDAIPEAEIIEPETIPEFLAEPEKIKINNPESNESNDIQP
jgi:hypothetical protein